MRVFCWALWLLWVEVSRVRMAVDQFQQAGGGQKGMATMHILHVVLYMETGPYPSSSMFPFVYEQPCHRVRVGAITESENLAILYYRHATNYACRSIYVQIYRLHTTPKLIFAPSIMVTRTHAVCTRSPLIPSSHIGQPVQPRSDL